ncbi:phage head-tail connector protein, partial [Enterococcus thailandicus]|uniref:phage head-tail connector protein n=1 Tax=Enterococcus thailandicus TaxID=417368 RepID=UPI0022E4654B
LGFLETVPAALNYIVVECTIKRFNRKGNEGMSSYGQEGESISYGKLLDEFEDDISAYKEKQKENSIPRRGVARFL